MLRSAAYETRAEDELDREMHSNLDSENVREEEKLRRALEYLASDVGKKVRDRIKFPRLFAQRALEPLLGATLATVNPVYCTRAGTSMLTAMWCQWMQYTALCCSTPFASEVSCLEDGAINVSMPSGRVPNANDDGDNAACAWLDVNAKHFRCDIVCVVVKPDGQFRLLGGVDAELDLPNVDDARMSGAPSSSLSSHARAVFVVAQELDGMARGLTFFAPGPRPCTVLWGNVLRDYLNEGTDSKGQVWPKLVSFFVSCDRIRHVQRRRER